ncbi:MAG: enoyl-CoA hydratase-related protein [Pseudomonadota bacterium]
MDEPIKMELREGVAVVTLNRPKAYNAFGPIMIEALTETFFKLTGDPDVLGVIITGAGRAFCAGANLKRLAEYGKPYGRAFHSLASKYHQVIIEIRRMPKPVVAAINGLAAGGGLSMALACDFRVMVKSALLRQAYTSNGLSIDGGGTYTLPRMVGMARAMEIAGLDRPISPEQALAWGLVTELAEDDRSVEAARKIIEEVWRRPLSSFAAAKKLITDSFDTSFEAQLEKERELLTWCADHPNGIEGITAFIEKRKPVYV